MMGVIKESSTEEAWELVGQDHKVIKTLVKQAGYKNDEESKDKLIATNMSKIISREKSKSQLNSHINLTKYMAIQEPIKIIEGVRQSRNKWMY